jgi:hypothetical protein
MELLGLKIPEQFPAADTIAPKYYQYCETLGKNFGKIPKMYINSN